MSPYKLYTFITVILVVISVFALYRSSEWHLLIVYFTVINLWTFVLYGWDKAIAPSSITRVPERVLHGIALVGGSPAALIGQKLFRHKTQKTSFLLVYALIVLVQIALITYLIMSDRISF